MDFEKELSEIYPWILKVARKFCCSMQDAEDLAGDTVYKLLVNRDKFDCSKPLQPWCLIIMRNTYIIRYNRNSLIHFTGLDMVDGSAISNCTAHSILFDDLVSTIQRCAKKSRCIAFAMFSALPVPQFDWNEKNMRYAMCAFPLIGAVCGALWCLCGALPLPALVRAGGFCLVPVWVTGGIHLDGYADTCDALSSYGGREKKLEILKDPRCGAFAVIRLCSYFLAYFALCTAVQFTPRIGLCWTLALVLERALSGLAIASFPLARNTGLAHTFASAADRKAVRSVLLVLAGLLSAALVLLGGGALVLAALLVFWRYRVVSDRQFGGINGDL